MPAGWNYDSPDSDNTEEVLNYWITIGGIDPALEHRIWDPDRRRRGRRQETRANLWRALEEADAGRVQQELVNEFQ